MNVKHVVVEEYYQLKKINYMKHKGGLIIPKICDCGKYEPTSTEGLIITKCKNCGGEKPKIKMGGCKICGCKRKIINKCPFCNSAMVIEDGCFICKQCGYAKS